MISAIEAVLAVQEAQLEEKQWIPPELQDQKTYFSAMDIWHYIGVYSVEPGHEQCEFCKAFDGNDFLGSELRSRFPDLKVEDENTIYVNYHMTLWGADTCKCYLFRVEQPLEPSTAYGEEPE